MKRVLILTALLVIAFCHQSLAQNCKKINFEETVDLHANLSPDQLAYKAMIPKTQTMHLELIFNNEMALLRTAPVKEKKKMGMMIKMDGGNFYMNLKDKLQYNTLSYGGEKFYTEIPFDELSTLKKTEGQKKILGYQCQAYTNHKGNMKVWVTKDLPAGLTPMDYTVVDGAILGIESEKYSYKATSIEDVSDCKDLKKPEGQKITVEQMEDLKDEMMSEMGKVVK